MTTVDWTCSACQQPLHLSGTLWRSPDDDPFCRAAIADPVAEQYAAFEIGTQRINSSRMHMPASNWIHPALLK